MELVARFPTTNAPLKGHIALRARLLGGFEATVDGVPLIFRSEKVRALFAYLLVEHGIAHRRSTLAALLWGGQSEEQALVNLRMTLLRLREALEPANLGGLIEADRVSIQLRLPSPEVLWCDVLELQRALDLQSTQAPDAAANIDVLALARGDFLAGLELRDAADFEEWARTQNAIFQQRLLVLLGWRAEALSARNSHERAIETARAMVTLDPWREESHQILMRLYARAGRRSNVLKHYQELEERLRQELGIQPSAESQMLLRSLLEQQATVGSGDNRESASINLPRTLTPFVARPELVDVLVQHVTRPDTRLVTLLGMGGSGKTRAAIEAARTSAPAFEHGVQFVALADVPVVAGIAPAILARIGAASNPRISAEEQLISLLRERNMLLVLDNFDHLTGAAAMIGRLCDQAPRLHLLVTSRHRLNLGSEWVVECGGMPYPRYEAEFVAEADPRLNKPLPSGAALRGAVELFVQSAQRLAPSFALSDTTLPGVLRICALVEGLPLGVELAAAGVRGMGPAEIADQIERHVDLLHSDEPDRIDRHRSLRAVYEQSWALLLPFERETLSMASVFRDGFSSAAALVVRPPTLDDGEVRRALGGLADKSLLYRRANQRFAMHELIRQFVREGTHSRDASALQASGDAHAHYYLNWLGGLAGQFRSGGQQAALDLMRDELENLQAAWRHACARAPAEPAFAPALARAAWPLIMFGDMRGRVRDSLELLTLATQTGAADPNSACWLQACLGHVYERVGRYEDGIALLTTCIADFGGDAAGRAFAHLGLGKILHRQNKIYEAVAEHSQALVHYEQTGDTHGCAIALHCRGMAYEEPQDFDKALQDLLRARELWRQTGDLRGLALTLNCMGIVREMQGNFQLAISLYQQSLAVFKQLNDLWGQGMALGNIGDVHMALRNHRDALRIQCINLELARDIWNVPGMLVALTKCGQVLWQLGRWQDAVQAIALAIDMPAQQVKFREIAQGLLDQAFELYPEDDVRDLYQAGQARSLDVTVGWMLAQARAL